MHVVNRIMLVVCLLIAQGCLPETAPKIVKGPISGNVAAQRMSKVRSDNGPSYRITHIHNGDEFEAAWEIGNALKRSTQIQIKPPIDWNLDDLQAGMRIALTDTPVSYTHLTLPTIYSV